MLGTRRFRSLAHRTRLRPARGCPPLGANAALGLFVGDDAGMGLYLLDSSQGIKRRKPVGILNDFKAFLLRGNVVDLAVAVVIGTAFGAVVTARRGPRHAAHRCDRGPA